jgi:aminomuconate-semialdehyde/2-hydroxymuconate-6-semialdehyde dehydrogenase
MNRAAQNFRFFATAAIQFSSESHAMEDKAINYTLRQPIGVVGCISPWNLPLYLFTWKIAPAIASGNAVVAKPSEFTPVTAFMLCELCNEAGLPAGVLNVVMDWGLKQAKQLLSLNLPRQFLSRVAQPPGNIWRQLLLQCLKS